MTLPILQYIPCRHHRLALLDRRAKLSKVPLDSTLHLASTYLGGDKMDWNVMFIYMFFFLQT